MKIRSISMPDDLDLAVIEAARRDGRKVSDWARRLIKREVGIARAVDEVTGETRLADLEEIAAAGREEYAESFKREKSPNATEIIAGSSTDGHARLAALNKIAKGSRR
jgi:hypothetical protein